MKYMEYISIYPVSAKPMDSETAKKEGYADLVEDYHGEGYELTYEGCKSWCTKSEFEKEMPLYKLTPLANTIERMVSSDYKERFEAEYEQLLERLCSLNRMVEKWDKGELEFTPTCPREIYDRQIRAMKDYLVILIERAGIEKVELKGTSYKF